MKFNIKMKLGLGFGLVLAMTCGLGVFSLTQMSAINGHANFIATNWLPAMDAAHNINGATSDLRVAELQVVEASNADQTDRSVKMVEEHIAEVAEAQKAYVSLIADAEEKALYEDYSKKFDAYLEVHKKGFGLATAGLKDAARQVFLGEGGTSFQTLQDATHKLVDYQIAGSQKSKVEAEELYAAAEKLVIGVLAAALLLGTGIAVLIIVGIMRGLKSANALAQAVAAGDLTASAEVRGSDEIADMVGTLNSMVGKLRSIVAEVQTAAANVAAGSHQLSATADQLSQGSTEQASSTEEASASMEEMSANIKQSADNAAQTENIARKSATDAAESGDAVERAVLPCRRLPRRLWSSRKSRGKRIFSRSMRQLRLHELVNTGAALRSLHQSA